VIGIFDSTKWHRRALLSFVDAAEVDAIVTDSAAPAELVAAWRAHGVEVVVERPRRQPRTPDQVPRLYRQLQAPAGDGR